MPNGEGKWYITQPTVNILTSNNPLATSIHYTLIGNVNKAETIAEITGATEDITECGITRVTAWVEDDLGRKSKEVTSLIKYDNIAPTVNTEVQASVLGENSWIRSNGEIKVTVTDEKGIVDGYEYEVYEKNTNKIIKDKTYVSNPETPIKIENDGEYTVIITGIDQAGNRSNVETNTSSTVNISKDTTEPEVDTPIIEVGNGLEVNVGVAAVDRLSGIWKYEYYIDNNTTPITTTYDLGWATLNGLNENQRYNIYVKVYDNAGNSIDTKSIPVNVKYSNENRNVASDIATLTIMKENPVGAYVDYEATGTSYTVNKIYSGYTGTEDQIFTNENLKWRIWETDENNLYLISEYPTTKELYLKGYQGYNNGVYLLDNICNTVYTNKSYKRLTAQNLKIEDIQKVTTYDYSQYTFEGVKYGERLADSYTNANSKYPQIWIEHDNKFPNPSASTAFGPYTQSTLLPDNTETRIRPYLSMWSHNFKKGDNKWNNSKYYELIISPTNDDSNCYAVYWLSTREVSPLNDFCRWGLYCVNRDAVGGSTLALSDNSEDFAQNWRLRPVVIIPHSSYNLTEITSENYHIEPN